MAADANVIAGAGQYRIRTAEERARAFLSASRHTRLVNLLRKALPIFAILVLATYFISTRLATSVSIGDMNASIEGMEVKDGNLRMLHPRLEGADKKNGKYVIGADYADQDIKNPNLITLHAIKADLAALDGGWSRVTASRGLFDNKTGRLVMRDKIDVSTSTGVSGTLTHASLDTKNQILRSHRPVSFLLPNGTIRANALTYYSANRTLTFRGKVAAHIVRPKKEEDGAKPASAAAPASPVSEAAPPQAVKDAPPETNAAPVTAAPVNAAPANAAPPPPAEAPGEVAMPPMPPMPPLPGESGATPSNVP